MTTFRLPKNCLSLFKDLSNSTIDNLYGLTPKLRGAKLYNAFSRPLGHKDFNALQADSKTYGLGEFNPHELVDALKSKTSGVHVHLGYEWDQTVKALDIACSLILIDYPELSSLDDHKPLRVSLLAEELGITDEELELLSWEPTANMSEDGSNIHPIYFSLRFARWVGKTPQDKTSKPTHADQHLQTASKFSSFCYL